MMRETDRRARVGLEPGLGRGGPGQRSGLERDGEEMGGGAVLAQPSPPLAPPYVGPVLPGRAIPRHTLACHSVPLYGSAWHGRRGMAGQRGANKTMHRMRFCMNLFQFIQLSQFIQLL